jgi:carboxyl-terminal processing protease
VLQAAYAAITERHLEATSPAQLALWSLRGLAALDPRLVVEERAGQLRLGTADRLLGQQPVRQDASAPVAALFEAGWDASAALRRAGSEGMLRAGFEELFNHLDPYSRYVTAEDARVARERRVGQSGLGLRLAAGQRDTVVLAAVTPGGPAAQAGLAEGDRLLAIDGIPVEAGDLGTAASLLEGPAGSVARLTVLRGRSRRQVTLLRRLFLPETLTSERRDDVLWLRISTFAASTGVDVAAALRRAFDTSDPPRGVVLDLRGNRGGVLSQATSVADAFLTDGVVARTDGRHPEARRLWQADGTDLAGGRPVIVLVDGRTASAAEIVAAALGDRQRAVVVGSTTMGKGLIQLLVPLPNGAELLVSWSQVLAPLGWPIQALGVLPSVCTSLGEQRLTEQLARLALGESPMAVPLARLRQARPPVPGSEVAALRGACPPAEGRDSDVTAAGVLLNDGGVYRAALRR